MLKIVTAAFASLSLVLAGAPALAQAAPQPVAESSLGSHGENAQAGGESRFLGYALLAAFGAASVWALVEILDEDGDGTPVSP